MNLLHTGNGAQFGRAKGREKSVAMFAAIDVGGTKIAIGIGDERGVFAATRVLTTNTVWPKDAVLDAIAAAVQECAQEAEAHDVRRVGLGSPGPLDGPVLLDSANLYAWKGINWKQGLESRLGVPVSVENDATAAGLGEWMYGAGKGSQNCLYVTVSTGIGAGIITGGKLYSGSRGNAGEFGHIVMVPNGPECPAGHHGCLESLASGTAIRRAGRERKADSGYLRSLKSIDTKDVFDGYLAGDSACVEIINEAADRLALGLSYLIDLFNPEQIILGGGVATHAPSHYRERVWQGMQRWALPALADAVRLVPAELGETSGLMGALAIAVESQA